MRPLSFVRNFFLNTLGYQKNSSFVIYRCFDDNVENPLLPDRRGKHTEKDPIREEMKKDIFSYQPTISHYHREHAPNVLYLPSDYRINSRKLHSLR